MEIGLVNKIAARRLPLAERCEVMNLLTKLGLSIILCAEISFAIQYGSFTDKRDGKKYRTVKIGNITWFAENLNYNAQKSKCYFDNKAYCQEYGRLYDFKTALKVCPKGTHLSTNQEWEILVVNIVGDEYGAKKLKSSKGWRLDEIEKNFCDDEKEWMSVGDRKEFFQWSPRYYCEHNGNGSDDLGFSILPAGCGMLSTNDVVALLNGNELNLKENVGYLQNGSGAYFWASSDAGGIFVRMIDVQDKFWSGGLMVGAAKYLSSVRCVVDY